MRTHGAPYGPSDPAWRHGAEVRARGLAKRDIRYDYRKDRDNAITARKGWEAMGEFLELFDILKSIPYEGEKKCGAEQSNTATK